MVEVAVYGTCNERSEARLSTGSRPMGEPRRYLCQNADGAASLPRTVAEPAESSEHALTAAFHLAAGRSSRRRHRKDNRKVTAP
jgi:hypothetical protein